MTTTYSILEVSDSSFRDIKQRLASASRLNDYLSVDDDKREILILGEIALKAEVLVAKVEIFSSPECIYAYCPYSQTGECKLGCLHKR